MNDCHCIDEITTRCNYCDSELTVARKQDNPPEITNPDDLIIDKLYWLVPRTVFTQSRPTLERLHKDSDPHFFTSNRMWASNRNSMAFERYRIFGPIPELVIPDCVSEAMNRERS